MSKSLYDLLSYSNWKHTRNVDGRKPNRPRTIDPFEVIERKVEKMIKRMRQLEAEGVDLSPKNPDDDRRKTHNYLRKLKQEEKESYIKRYVDGELKLSDLPVELFPLLKENDLVLDDRKNWRNHLHHHLVCEMMKDDRGINVYCYTCCDHNKGKLISTFYKNDVDFIKIFRKKNEEGTRSHPFFKCEYCKCQISVLNFYREYQLNTCPNCDSPEVRKMRDVEAHDPVVFRELSARERLKFELKDIVDEKLKDIEAYNHLDNREIILCKYPKATKKEYIEELQRRRIRIVLRPDQTWITDPIRIAQFPKPGDDRPGISRFDPKKFKETDRTKRGKRRKNIIKRSKLK